MARQTKIVNLSLPPDVFAEVDSMAKEKGKSRSEILREALSWYTETNKLWKQIYRWGEESAQKLGIKDERDVDRLVHEFREGQL